VRGAVHEGETPIAVYYAEPAGMPKYPMLRLGLVVGRFADDARPQERRALCFVCRPGGADGAQLEPSEPWLASFPEMSQLGLRLAPEDLAADADAPRLRALAQAVIAGDDRLAPMRVDATGGAKGRAGARRHAFARARAAGLIRF
jgi:hypothetical protein